MREKHGMVGTRIYQCWCAMKGRCGNPNNTEYKNYGGRGIKYCERWEKFSNFYDDMSGAYTDELTLDRIDVNGNYCPENCRWATKAEQNDNRRGSYRIDYNGELLTITQLSDRLGINRYNLWSRMHRYKMPWNVAISDELSKKWQYNQDKRKRYFHAEETKRKISEAAKRRGKKVVAGGTN